MGGSFPLTDRAGDAVLFRLPQRVVTAQAFLGEAQALAGRLPPGRHLINLCRDRYAFAVAFAAGLLAGRTALLNVEPARVDALAREYAGCSVVADEPVFCKMPVTMASRSRTGGSRTGGSGLAGGRAAPVIEAGHVAAIVFTSGSTGAPVAHPKRWGALAARSRAAAAAFGFATGTELVGTVPPQHMYGFELTVLLPFHAPVCSWCGPAFFPGDVAAAARSCGRPWLVTTPLQVRTLLQSGTALPLSGAISATAPLDPALARAAEAAWGIEVREIFGATECGSIASRRTTDGEEWVAYPAIDLVVDDAVDSAADCRGAVISAPFMDAVALADVLERTAGGFRLRGRRTDVVKLGGRRASLPGLNQVLTEVQGVHDGAFLVPDDLDQRSTARLVAVVVAPGRSGPAILADLRRVLDPVFLPRRVIRVERLPRNELGKLPRQALLEIVAGAA